MNAKRHPDDTDLATADSPAGVEEPPCILVLHASVGSGHRTAAEAIAEAYRQVRDDPAVAAEAGITLPPDLEVEVLDILDFARVSIDGNKWASSFTGATRPLYDLRWRYEFTGRLLWGGGTIWLRIMFPKFTGFIARKKPLAIIATHITAANVAVGARMLTGQHFPLVCVPTDYEVEGNWPHKQTDLFCVANEHMAETLRPRKVPDRNILITGIPTSLAFSRTYDREEVRRRLGLPLDKRVVIALAGATLPAPYANFRKALDALIPYLPSFPDLHFVFIAGRDREYADHIRRVASDLGLKNVTVFDYVNPIAELLNTSDLIICKPGGLTVTECLCARLPMVLLGKAYGQEKANVRMLTSTGAAISVTTTRELVDMLRQIDRNPEITEAVLVNASFVRRPHAALDIVRATERLIEEFPSLPRHPKHFLTLYRGRKPAHLR